MMEHMQKAHDRLHDMQRTARAINPDKAAKWCVTHNAPVLALVSIMARGHWMLVNGHWLRKEKDGVYL